MRELVVDVVDGAAFPAVHGLEGAGVEEPLEDLGTAFAERVVETLVDSSAEAVERYSESGDADLGHFGGHLPHLWYREREVWVVPDACCEGVPLPVYCGKTGRIAQIKAFINGCLVFTAPCVS